MMRDLNFPCVVTVSIFCKALNYSGIFKFHLENDLSDIPNLLRYNGHMLPAIIYSYVCSADNVTKSELNHVNRFVKFKNKMNETFDVIIHFQEDENILTMKY